VSKPDWFESTLNGLPRDECVRRLAALKVPHPWVLYKFCGPASQNVDDIIERSRFYLSSPAQFNDPFDTAAAVTFTGTAEQYFAMIYRIAIEHGQSPSDALFIAATNSMSERPDYQHFFDKRIAEWGVTCFITSASARAHAARNILMWSHYGDSHRGLCFQFHLPRAPGVLATAVRVDYSDDFVIADWAQREEVESKLGKALLRKAKVWEYEHERRIVRTAGTAGTKLQFDPAGLRGVVIGLRASDATVTNLVDRCKARNAAGHPRVNLYRTAKVPGHYQLRICRARDLEALVYG
jgi:Protein of unknown function (DUF2971)